MFSVLCKKDEPGDTVLSSIYTNFRIAIFPAFFRPQHERGFLMGWNRIGVSARTNDQENKLSVNGGFWGALSAFISLQ